MHGQKNINTLRTGDADLRLYAYKQFKYPVPQCVKFPEADLGHRIQREIQMAL
jgi:hypothetical protein